MKQAIPFVPDDAPFSVEQRAWLNGFLAGLYSTANESAMGAPTLSLKIAVLYATQSGTSERLAKKLVKELRQRNHTVELASLDSYTPAALAEQSYALVIASTYGDGDPPDGTQSFFESLSLLSAPRLDSLRYAILALGDRTYEHFCKFGADLDARLYTLGGTRLCERVDCGVDIDEPFAEWKNAVLARLSLEKKRDEHAAGPGAVRRSQVHTRDNPYLGELIEKRPLTHEMSSKLTVHVAVSLAGSAIHYEAGDACGIHAENDPALVDEILSLTKFSAEAILDLPKVGTTTLLDALTNHVQFSRLTRKMVQAYSLLGGCSRLERLLVPDNQRELEAYMHGRSLIDLIEECPGVLASPAQLVEILPKLSPRLYSISSSPAYHSGQLHTTVAVVRYRSHNRDRGGICSTMLNDRIPVGARVPIYIQPNERFRLPADGSVPIIMIGPGTGIAPFRSFLHERRARGAKGRNWLFFGARSASSDFLYKDELQTMHADGHLTRLDTAFSRDQEQKVYVQDRMMEAGAEFWRWLADGASVYVCGDAAHMAGDVDAALHRIVEEYGDRDSESAKEFVQELQEQNRYHRDVY